MVEGSCLYRLDPVGELHDDFEGRVLVSEGRALSGVDKPIDQPIISKDGRLILSLVGK